MHHFPRIMSLKGHWDDHTRWLNRFPGKLFRLICMAVLTVAIAIGGVPTGIPASWGQLPSLPTPTTTPRQSTTSPPDNVQRLGSIEVTTVQFDGENLFKIASPTVRDRTNPGNVVPVEVRAEQIEANLERVIQDDLSVSRRGINATTNYELETLEVYPSTLNGANVIFVKDARHPEPLQILTVTQADADYYGLPLTDTTEYMRDRINSELRESLAERSAETLEEKFERSLLILVGMVIASLVLWLGQTHLRARERSLTTQLKTATTPTEAEMAGEGSQSVRANLRQQFSWQRRLAILAFFRWLLLGGIAVIWIMGTSIILAKFPWTRQLGTQVQSIPLKLILVWFVVGLLNRLSDTGLAYLAKVWHEHYFFGDGDTQRKSSRISTAINALQGLKTFLIAIIGITWALGVIGLPIGSVLAIGGIIAFAISLGFQNLVKDVVNGFLILLEDQYAIGDVIAIGTESGLVENVNLRITQLRNGEGQLITIPNSSIVQVRNLTRTWSRVDFAIDLAYDTDIDSALDVLRQVGDQLYAEPEWRDRILESPTVLGVDQLSHMGMQVRIWIKTQPGQQWLVGREFRRRVRVALAQHGIEIGKPQQDLWQKQSPLDLDEGQGGDRDGHESGSRNDGKHLRTEN